MNRRVVFVSACAAVLAMSVAVFGQPPGGQRGPGRGMGGPMWSLGMLAQSEPVQKELGVTEEQKSKLAEAAQAARGQRGGQRDFQNLSDEERAKLREEMVQRRAEQDKKITAILDDKQVARLKQIQIQAAGARIVMNEEVAAELRITDAQREKVNEELRKLRAPGQEGGPGELAEMRARGRAVLMDALTADQKDAYEKLAGKPFDLSQLRAPGRGRPQRGN